jgi:hypothetical protein
VPISPARPQLLPGSGPHAITPAQPPSTGDRER